MTDKYEEFKEWLAQSKYKIYTSCYDISYSQVFKEFELEQEEQKKEKEMGIKIARIVYENIDSVEPLVIDGRKLYRAFKEYGVIKDDNK